MNELKQTGINNPTESQPQLDSSFSEWPNPEQEKKKIYLLILKGKSIEELSNDELITAWHKADKLWDQADWMYDMGYYLESDIEHTLVYYQKQNAKEIYFKLIEEREKRGLIPKGYEEIKAELEKMEMDIDFKNLKEIFVKYNQWKLKQKELHDLLLKDNPANLTID